MTTESDEKSFIKNDGFREGLINVCNNNIKLMISKNIKLNNVTSGEHKNIDFFPTRQSQTKI